MNPISLNPYPDTVLSFLIKYCNFFLGLQRISKLKEKKEHSARHKMKFINFFLCLWDIFALLYPDPDCEYGSTTLFFSILVVSHAGSADSKGSSGIEAEYLVGHKDKPFNFYMEFCLLSCLPPPRSESL